MIEIQTEDVAQTLARYEALAIETGEWAGTDAPEFSRDGVTWLPVWVPETRGEVPPFARGTVHRKGAASAVAVLSWEEHVPEQRAVAPGEIDWYAKWMQNPMSLFGSAALRRAYQRAFRDVIGDPRTDPRPAAPVKPAAPRDWDADLAVTETVADVDALFSAADAAGDLTPTMATQFRHRRNELKAHADPRRAHSSIVGDTGPAGPVESVPEAPRAIPHPPRPDVPRLVRS